MSLVFTRFYKPFLKRDSRKVISFDCFINSSTSLIAFANSSLKYFSKLQLKMFKESNLFLSFLIASIAIYLVSYSIYLKFHKKSIPLSNLDCVRHPRTEETMHFPKFSSSKLHRLLQISHDGRLDVGL